MKKRRLSLLVLAAMAVQLFSPVGSAAAVGGAPLQPEDRVYTVPAAPNVDYNMNTDWKFKLADVSIGSDTQPVKTALQNTVDAQGHKLYEKEFDDSSWETVSVPHNYSDDALFDNLAQGGGDGGNRAIALYRKHFTVGAEHTGKKMLLEFEGLRQAAFVWVNGQYIGSYEAGVDPFGMDITAHVVCGQDNVIALVNDGTTGRGMTQYHKETRPGSDPGERDGTAYQWNSNDFNPTVAGLTRDVILHVKNPVYQTLPLYSNLKTMGAYVYGSDFDIPEKTATITVEAEVRNESNAAADLSLEVAVVDRSGKLQYAFTSDGTESVPVAADKGTVFKTVVASDAYDENPAKTDTSTVEVKKITASAKVGGLRFWSTKDPYLYNVYSVLKSGNEVLDVTKITTGFRKVETLGGTSGGVYINDELVWLTGYAQRSTNEWAAIGSAVDWLRDYDMAMVRESNGNFIRWMHVAAQPVDIRAADKYGVACIQPAGDKEGEPAAGTYHNRQWDQRVEAMRDTIIYFRNSPSILFWEAGNSFIRAAYMKEMTDLRKELDPHGMRAMGCRALADEQDAVDESEYVGTMLGRKVEDDNGFTGNGELTRDKRAILESEYHREESPRRVWDDYSPPDYDYVHGSVYGLTDTEGDSWDMTAEDFLRTAVKEYNRYFKNRVSSNSSRPIYSAAAALCWTDSTQHGRNHLTENARMSGRVDPARVKKQSFYAYQVLQSTKPAVYVMGHWNYSENKSDYPKGLDPTDKTVYVIASNCKYVELLINGESVAKNGSPENGFLYAFKNIDVTQHGKIEAIARNTKGEELARHTIETAGEAAEIRLTPHTGPEGLLADGSDIAYFDVEIVDANGIVLPLDYRQLNLSLTGDATLRGGYNSGYYVNYGTGFMSASDAHYKTVNGKNVIHVGELNADPNVIRAECGTNRVFVRAGRQAGNITLTVSGGGLTASSTITSKTFTADNGLTVQKPQQVLDPEIDPDLGPVWNPVAGMKPLTEPLDAVFGEGGNTVEVEEEVIQKKVITVKVNGTAVDFGKGDSGEQLVAYEMAQSVFAPIGPFATAIGATWSGNAKSLTITHNGQTVKLDESLMTFPDGTNTSIINQMAQMEDGVLHVEISAIAKGFGFQTNNWSSGMTEFTVKTS